MKKVFFSISILILTGCFENKSSHEDLEGKEIPAANLLLSDSSYFNTSNIPAGRSIIMFYFSPSCPYCRAQMLEMTEKHEELKNTQVYVMTFSKFKPFKTFLNEYGLNRYSNITAGVDFTNSIARFFKIRHVPFTAVFNDQKKLSKVFNGRTSVQEIKEALLSTRATE
jgi:peroxiredoxin